MTDMTSLLFVFGLGYSALHLARRLKAKGIQVSGTVRSEDKAATLARVIEQLRIENDGERVPVSATYGIFAITGAEDAKAAIAAADKEMYRRKQGTGAPGRGGG